MKSLKLPISVQCPLHAPEIIQRVNLDPSSSKELYCIECIIEHDISDSSALHSLEDFLATTFAFYSSQKNIQGNSVFEAPVSNINVLKNKAENLTRLEQHIAEEKVKVEELFKNFSNEILSIIDQKKKEHLSFLDEQLANFKMNYSFFEEQIKRGFPRNVDNLSILSSQELLNNTFSQIDEFSQLSYFIKRIKKDFQKNEQGININQQDQERRKDYFKRLLGMLESAASKKPTFNTESINFHPFMEEIKKKVEESIDKLFFLQDTILSGGLSCDELESHILKPENFELIRNWIPPKYSFVLQLLYRGSQHGFTPEAFHSRCDKRGPTITVIECQFLGSNKRTIIGGFLDKDWHNKNTTIDSTEAFLFSIDAACKCLLSESQAAAYGGDYLPMFGEGFDICLSRDLRQSFVNPQSYINSKTLVDPSVYRGPGSLYYFIPHNIEVYALR